MSALAEIQRRVQATTALIEELERAASRPDAQPSVFANIRGLDKLRRRLVREFEEIARQEEMEVCRYSLLVDTERLTLTALAGAWQNFQKVLTLTYNAVVHGPKETGRVGIADKAATALAFGYTFSGSVGVVVTLPSDQVQPATTERSLLGVAQTVFNLAKAQTTEQVAEFAKTLGAPPIRAMYRWADVHAQNDLGAGIEWTSPDDRKISLLVQKEELVRLRDVIAETSQSEETVIEVTGELRAVDTVSHSFKLMTADGEMIVGKYGDVIGPARTVVVPATYSVSIRRTTKIQYSTESVEILNVLLSLKTVE